MNLTVALYPQPGLSTTLPSTLHTSIARVTEDVITVDSDSDSDALPPPPPRQGVWHEYDALRRSVTHRGLGEGRSSWDSHETRHGRNSVRVVGRTHVKTLRWSLVRAKYDHRLAKYVEVDNIARWETLE